MLILEYFVNMIVYSIGGYGYELFVETMEDTVEFYRELTLKLRLHYRIHLH